MTKVTELAALTTPADADLLHIIDDPSGTPTSKKVTVEDVLRPAYGEISVTGGSGSQTFSAATWTKVTQFTANGESKNTTNDHTNDKITVTNTGYYFAVLSVSFTGTTSSLVDIAIRWNGTAFAQCQRKLGTGTDVGSASCAGMVNVSSGSTDFEVWAKTDGADAFDVKEADLTVVRVF